MFLFTNETEVTANYAYDNTYASKSTTYSVIEWLEECSGDIFSWLENNGIKAKPKNAIFMLLRKKLFQL